MKRILSGAILILFLLAVVVFNRLFPLALNLAIAVISVMAVWEIISALKLSKKWFITIPSMAFSAILPLLEVAKDQHMLSFIFTVVLFCALIFHSKEVTFREVGIVYSMSLMIPYTLSALIKLRDLGNLQGLKHGMFYLIIAVLSAWVADAGALFAGKLLGKHQLCPNISPKKTIEGAIGGLLVNIIAMLILGFAFSSFYNHTVEVSYFVLILIAVGGSVLSIIGDLSFSLIKRGCQIKDFGEIIPGHGGILDRFDSVIFVVPFVYFLVSYLPIVVG